MIMIPDSFIRDTIILHGNDGRDWIERLPAILAQCAEQWEITIGEPFPNLSFHYVAPATRKDGTPVVVKASSPTNEFFMETEAIRLFDGHGMAQLLEFDPQNEVMLLECLTPGTLLKEVQNDEQATSIAADVMRKLWRPAPARHPFPTVQDWGKGFTRLRQHYQGGSGPFPPRLLDEAETLFADLCNSMAEPMLLHGDLHHENILSATREPWLAIDPKGLIGEPDYETGALIRNPQPQLSQWPDIGRILARRIDQLAEELNFDRKRIRDWAVAQMVLSMWWTVEDSGRFEAWGLACAEHLAAIKV